MTTTRSLVADTSGEPSEVLHLHDRPIPQPGPGEVRIKVVAAPVHASDLHTIRGRYGFTPEFPTVPGIESVGVVDELGSGTAGLSVGQRVITIGVPGTWQEYVVAEAQRVLPVPACSRALSTHRHTDPDKLAIPIFARSLIYETKTVRGFWLFCWITETPKDRMAAAIDRTLRHADSGVLRVLEGRPVPLEMFSEAVHLAEAPERGGKPLLVFEP